MINVNIISNSSKIISIKRNTKFAILLYIYTNFIISSSNYIFLLTLYKFIFSNIHAIMNHCKNIPCNRLQPDQRNTDLCIRQVYRLIKCIQSSPDIKANGIILRDEKITNQVSG